MSRLFNRDAVMKGLAETHKFSVVMEAYFLVITKSCTLIKRATSDEDLKVDICNSLELICNLIEDRANGLFDHYKDSYEEEVMEVHAAAMDFTQKDHEFKYGKREVTETEEEIFGFDPEKHELDMTAKNGYRNKQ